jgi:hypothetical protein
MSDSHDAVHLNLVHTLQLEAEHVALLDQAGVLTSEIGIPRMQLLQLGLDFPAGQPLRLEQLGLEAEGSTQSVCLGLSRVGSVPLVCQMLPQLCTEV